MTKKLFYILFVIFLIFYLYWDYKKIMNLTIPDVEDIAIKIPKIPVVQMDTPKDVVIDKASLWNIEEKNIQIFELPSEKKETSCITYIAKKEGKIYTILTSQGKQLYLFGIINKNGKKYAIFYNKNNPKEKIFLVKKDEKIDKFLKLKDIKYNKIILENISKCPEKQTLVLEIFTANLDDFQKKGN